MQVIEVVPSISEEASGPSYSVAALCRAVAAPDVEVSLHVLGPAPELPDFPGEVHPHSRWGLLRRLGISPAMRDALALAAEQADILHSHSLWMMPNIYPAWAARGKRCRLVTSPRGTFSPQALRRSRLRKRILWHLWQGRAVRESACLHATAEAEVEQIRRVGLRHPVAVIPNGIDLPEALAEPEGDASRRRLLFLGRIHPIKGVDLLLRAWRNVQETAPDWELKVVGPDREGTLRKMQELASSLGVERVSFPGGAYGEEKSREYRQASLFVLPTHTENFGVTVAEALAHGVPAIVSRGAPWEGLDARGCGWWIDRGEGPLTECLRVALALSEEELRRRGRRGRDWMERDFSWGRVGEMMVETYRWLLGGGTEPEWVRTVP